MLSAPALVLLVMNVGLLWLLLAAPLGTRTIRLKRIFAEEPRRVWSHVHPLGEDAGWMPTLRSSRPGPDGSTVIQELSAPDREGRPIRRVLNVTTVEEAERRVFEARVVEDSALEPAFWSNYRERRSVRPAPGGTELTVEVTDRYRGMAFLIMRFFRIRREMQALESWLETGRLGKRLRFEHPLVQVALAGLSILVLWPFFGLDATGLMISTMLTAVIAVHELGHLVAYRAFGHEKVRMIFLPLLGGIAMGGRPYRTVFEVAFCALMGAGFSALFVPIMIAASTWFDGSGQGRLSGYVIICLLVLTGFNLLNLLPMSRFDGGQVLKQLFPSHDALMAASFLVSAAILWTGHRIGISLEILIGALAVMALLSMTNRLTVKPREPLLEMRGMEVAIAGVGYFATLAVHAWGLVYAAENLFS